MPNSGDNPDEDSTSEEEITALVPQRQFARNRLAERQQAILKQLHRRAPSGLPLFPLLYTLPVQFSRWMVSLVVVLVPPGPVSLFPSCPLPPALTPLFVSLFEV